MNTHSPKLALSNTFLDAFGKLPKPQRAKVQRFIDKYRADPTASAIDFEKLKGFKDEKIRTVRIDQAYRAVIVMPPKGDVMLLVWVAHHDDAHDWARNRCFNVHPSTGQLQIYSVDELETRGPSLSLETLPDEDPMIPEGRLLAGWRNSDLTMVGVPEPLIPTVRAFRRESEIDDLSRWVQEDIIDALYGLAANYTPEQVLAALGATTDEVIDTSDFAAAMERAVTLRHFVMVDDEDELVKILNAPLEKWRVFLHPSQRDLVAKDYSGPARVLGAAGTGKTVVLLHRARHLAANPEHDRVFVTTFTRNLANDLSRQLQAICSDDEWSRLHVENIHSWAAGLLTTRGFKVRHAQPKHIADSWNAVLDLRASELAHGREFYRSEWERVVQANDLTDRNEYLRFARTGRGTPVSRRQRVAIWDVFEAFRNELRSRQVMEAADIIREARITLERSGEVPFRCVLADEVQDFSAGELRLLRAMAPQEDARNDLFLVGDAHQRIYGKKTTFSHAGVHIRGRSSRLRLNYRTTEPIRDYAVRVLDDRKFDDLDGGTDSLEGYRSLRGGDAPSIEVFETAAAEADHIIAVVASAERDGVAHEEIVIAARTGRLVDELTELLEERGLDCVRVKSEESASADGVRVATMHRLKGLEFRGVVLARVQRGVLPIPLSEDFADAVAEEEHLIGERSLLYVAATRARDWLVVTGVGEASELLPGSIVRD